jgi:hypothetical protein
MKHTIEARGKGLYFREGKYQHIPIIYDGACQEEFMKLIAEALSTHGAYNFIVKKLEELSTKNAVEVKEGVLKIRALLRNNNYAKCNE